jgi:hypothetical protein
MGTGIPGATIRGMHLRLPGYGDGGPTIEVFQYNQMADRPTTAVNRPGWDIWRSRWMMSSLLALKY